MPRVERGAHVTLVALVYRSMRWLEWCMAGVEAAHTEAKYRWLVVANDADGEVISALQDTDFDWVDHRNVNPGEWYIPRVYRAWNRGVLEARTPQVVMLNSDMWASDFWLDELLDTKRGRPQTVPTSLLVESGRMESAMPEYVRDFGRNPDAFDAAGFKDHAATLRQLGGREPGRLFMPILVDRQEFMDVGGYPEGNPPGTTGDKDLIRRYKKAGFDHVTALGSVVYHVQTGEQEWP